MDRRGQLESVHRLSEISSRSYSQKVVLATGLQRSEQVWFRVNVSSFLMCDDIVARILPTERSPGTVSRDFTAKLCAIKAEEIVSANAERLAFCYFVIFLSRRVAEQNDKETEQKTR